MKRVAIWLLLLVLIGSLAACGDDGEMASAGGGSSDKVIDVVCKNTSGTDWVMEYTTYGTDECRGETDAIYAKDFVVADGENFMTLSGVAESYDQVTAFSETSDTTYEYRVQLVAGGPMPTDPEEQYVYDPYVAVVDFIITGIYADCSARMNAAGSK